MTVKKQGALLWALMLFVMTASGCAMLEDAGLWQKPEARVSSVELTELTFESAGLDVIVDVFNPNPYKISLGLLDYTLTVQGRQFLDGRQDKKTWLGAEQAQAIAVPIRVRFEDLFAAVSGLKQKNAIDYGLNGGVSFEVPVAGMIRIPFEKQGRLPVPAMPKVSVEGLRLDDLSLMGASLKLTLAMENTNDFGISLDRFDYSFKLNNNAIAGGKAAARLAAGPGATSRVELPIDLSFARAGRALYSLLAGGQDLDYTLVLDGEAISSHKILSSFPFHTDKTGTIKLKR